MVGLMAMMADDPEHPDVFLLTDSEHGETHTPMATIVHFGTLPHTFVSFVFNLNDT